MGKGREHKKNGAGAEDTLKLIAFQYTKNINKESVVIRTWRLHFEQENLLQPLLLPSEKDKINKSIFEVCFVLFYFVLFCFILFCFVLFCFVLFCFVLFCFVLFCFVLFCFVLFYLIFYVFSLMGKVIESCEMEIRDAQLKINECVESIRLRNAAVCPHALLISFLLFSHLLHIT